MATVLEKQLQQLSRSRGFAPKPRSRTKASLLFDQKEAAALTAEEIFQIGKEGYESLCRLDRRFAPFGATLFGGVPQERDLLTREENKKIDESVKLFLRILTDYFLDQSATRALEHLVRSFRVHELNVDALMHCALPYHTTFNFLKLVQIMHLDNTIWAFLTSMKSTGATLPRSTLVERAVRDKAVLRFVCDMAKAAGEATCLSHVVFPFFAVVVCEVLKEKPVVTEDLVALLVPVVVHGLTRGSSEDFRAATHMILAQLSAAAALGEKLLSVLLEALLYGVGPEGADQAVTVVCHIYNTQCQYQQLPETVFKCLAKIPQLAQQLGRLTGQGVPVKALAHLILLHCAMRLGEQPIHQSLLLELVALIPMEGYVTSLLRALLDRGLNAGSDEGSIEAIQRIITQLDSRFPEQMDKSVNKILADERKRKGKKRMLSGEAKDIGAAEQSTEKSIRVLQLLQGCLATSIHRPHVESGMTIAHAIDSPAAEVRKEALEVLSQLTQDPECNSETKAFALTTALQRLADDDFGVVVAALAMPCLEELPSEQLFGALSLALSKAVAAVSSAKEDTAAAEVADKILKMFGAHFLQHNTPMALLRVVQESLVLNSSNTIVAKSALQVAQSVEHPLTNALKAIATSGADESTRIAEALTEAHVKYNCEVVDHMANAAMEDPLLQMLSDLLNDVDVRGKHFVLLVLNHVCHKLQGQVTASGKKVNSNLKGGLKKLSLSILSFVLGDWTSLSTAKPSVIEMHVENFSEDAKPLAGHVLLLSRDPCAAYCQVLCQSLLMAFKGLSHGGWREWGDDAMFQDLFVKVANVGGKGEAMEPLADALVWQESAFAFLLEMVCSSSTDVTELARIAALKVLGRKLKMGPGLGPVKDALGWSFYLLSALSNDERSVRKAAFATIVEMQKWLMEQQSRGKLEKRKFALAQFMEGLLVHRKILISDSSAIGHILRGTLQNNVYAGLRSSSAVALPSPEHGTNTGVRVDLPRDVVQNIIVFLQELLPTLTSPSSCQAAKLAVTGLQFAVSSSELITCSLPILEQLEALAMSLGSVSDEWIALVDEIVPLYGTKAAANFMGSKSGNLAVDAFAKLLFVPRNEKLALRLGPLRAGALDEITGEWFDLLGSVSRARLVRLLLVGHSCDPHMQARESFRTALERIQLRAEDLVPLLGFDAAALEINEDSSQGTELGTTQKDKLQLCLWTLELLQWKEGVAGEVQLIGPLQNILENELWIAEARTSPALPVSVSLGYMLKLTLLAFNGAVERATDLDSVKGLKVDLIIRCVRGAANASLRNPALMVLTNLATKMPQETLNHVLEVLSVVGSAGALAEDDYAESLATQALKSVLPAWLSRGHSPHHLWQVTGNMIKEVQHNRRLSILEAVLGALPQEVALPMAIVTLLQMFDDSKEMLEGDEASEDLSIEIRALLHGLCRKVPPSQRGFSLAQAMALAVAECDGDVTAHLPQIVVSFVTGSLMLLSASNNQAFQENGVPCNCAPSGGELILKECLKQLAALKDCESINEQNQFSIQNAEGGLQLLLQGLKRFMVPGHYIKSLAEFLEHPKERIARHVFKLLTDKLRDMKDELLAVPSEASHALEGMAEPVLRVCEPLCAVLSSEASELHGLTRQNGFVVLQLLVRLYGATHPSTFLPLLAALPRHVRDRNSAVRGSAMATMAAMVKQLKENAVPCLPELGPAVLESLESVVTAASIPAGKRRAQNSPEAQPEKAHRKKRRRQSEPQDKPEALPPKPTEESRQGGAAGTSQQTSQLEGSTAIEVGGGLAVILALSDHLGGFVSPYIERIIGLALHPQVQHCEEPTCALVASKLCSSLAAHVPARLLSRPLFSHLDAAVASGGPRPVVALLEMAGAMAAHMDAGAVATHHERVFEFLLSALGLRERAPWPMAQTAAVESACVSAFLSLVMKLSERQFRPLFSRLLEWSGRSGVGAVPEGRRAAFYRLVAALAQRLRSMFAPYFRHVLPDAVEILSRHKPPTEKKVKKRRKAGAEEPPLAERQTAYLLVLEVVRCIHRCCQYDNVGLMDQDRFEAVFPGVVCQLRGPEPEREVLEGLGEGLEPELEGGLAAAREEGAETLGVAVVGCLAQMAVVGGSDAMWKPLNRKVLVTARKGGRRTRLLALAVLHELVDRLKDEYLPLVPETLQYLSELLEDSDQMVANKTRKAIKAMEELSSEKLDRYLKP